MDNENAQMAGGHCMGFSVTALRMFTGTLRPQKFGAKKPIDLDIPGTPTLQSTIAENWVFQDLPGVDRHKVMGSPNHILRSLQNSLAGGSDTYTIGILNDTGGHAVTPFAIEDKGGGIKNVLIYDNNFPAVIRAIRFDTNSNTWLYHGGPNPKDLHEVYQGNADAPNMELFPTNPGLPQQPCPFCSGAASTSSGGKVGKALSKSRQYDEITLKGNPVNHAHLVLTDEQGRQTGFVNGKIVNQIPGVRVNRSLTIQNWREAPEPTYRIPTGGYVRVTIDGSDLARPDKESINLIGPAREFEIDDIHLTPGKKDYVTFKAGGAGVNYETKATIGSAPSLFAGITEGSGRNFTAYEFAATAPGIEGALNLALVYDRKAGAFGIDTEGTTGDLARAGYPGKALYVLNLTKSTTDGKVVGWTTNPRTFFLRGGEPGETAVIDYRSAQASQKTVPVTILGAHNRTRMAKAYRG
jgi:hypothetical protein